MGVGNIHGILEYYGFDKSNHWLSNSLKSLFKSS
jgi:hypothetical protein